MSDFPLDMSQHMSFLYLADSFYKKAAHGGGKYLGLMSTNVNFNLNPEILTLSILCQILLPYKISIPSPHNGMEKLQIRERTCINLLLVGVL